MSDVRVVSELQNVMSVLSWQHCQISELDRVGMGGATTKIVSEQAITPIAAVPLTLATTQRTLLRASGLREAGIIDSIRLSLLQEDTQLGQDVTEDVYSVRVRKEGCEEREEEPEKKKKRTFFLRTSCFVFFGVRSPVTIFPVQIR